MKKFNYVLLSGFLLYRLPLFPVRSAIRNNLDLYNYLKVSLLNLKHFSFRFGYIREKSIWVFDDWSDNYFHWTFDVLIKLFALKKSDDCKNILIPERLLQFTYVIETLNAFGYKITVLNSNKTYVVKEIVSQQNVAYFSKEILTEIKSAVFKKVLPQDTLLSFQNIYISRSKALRRKILNEDALLQVLNTYDFKTVYLENMTWQEQVLLFRNTKLVVAMHGAGLSNMLYAEKMKGVIELRPSSSQNGLFQLLASECSIPYRAISISAPGSTIHDENFALDDESIKMINTYILELTSA